MRKAYLATIFWWPAILRLTIFSLMTSGGVFLSQLDGKTTKDFAGFGWVEWSIFWGPIVVSWLGTKLAFLDQTMGKLREERDTQVWKKGETI